MWQPTSLRILLVSDEVSLMAETARDALKGYEYQLFDDTDLTRSLAAMQGVHGLAIDVVPEEQFASAVAARYRLGLDYDAFAIYTVRIWRLAKHVQKVVDQARTLPGHGPLGERIAGLPIALMNPVNLVTSGVVKGDDIAALQRNREFYLTLAEENFAELAGRARATWEQRVLQELEYEGVGISFDEAGRVVLSGAYRRPPQESFYFAVPDQVARSGERLFRIRAAKATTSEAILALEEALTQARSATAKKQEELLQHCLARYPALVTMGLYRTAMPQVQLNNADPLQGKIVPDFVALDCVLPGMETRSAVVELKSSEMRLMIRHKATKELIRALDQLGMRYRRYFENVKNAAEQRRQLGQVLHEPRLMLVIGRSAWREEWEDVRQKQAESAYRDLRIVSYDDLGEFARMRVATFKKGLSDAS